MSKPLLTGGSGLLGTQLQRHREFYAPPHAHFDVRDPDAHLAQASHYIVHAAAYTEVANAEHERDLAWEVNALGTRKMVELGLPLAYISTEYVFDGAIGNYSEDDAPHPLNWYAMTKWVGEQHALERPENLVIRCLFKAWPYRYDKACADQWTSGDYVEVIAPLVNEAIGLWRLGRLSGIVHLGTGRKQMLALARASNPKVKRCSRSDIEVPLPFDTSLNTDKWSAARGH
jgi:dTDP-4-dehydrorhamnose reductase